MPAKTFIYINKTQLSPYICLNILIKIRQKAFSRRRTTFHQLTDNRSPADGWQVARPVPTGCPPTLHPKSSFEETFYGFFLRFYAAKGNPRNVKIRIIMLSYNTLSQKFLRFFLSRLPLSGKKPCICVKLCKVSNCTSCDFCVFVQEKETAESVTAGQWRNVLPCNNFISNNMVSNNFICNLCP